MKSPDMALAVKMYYEKPELTSADIKKLFDVGGTTAARLKKKAMQQMLEKEVKTWLPNTVNTKIAYDTWGIDVNDFEDRLKKLSSLKKSGVIV